MRLFLVTVLLVCTSIWALEPVVLDDCEDLGGWTVSRKPATFSRAPDAAQGDGAILVTMPGNVQHTLAKSYVSGSAAWDAYEGFSFWVKGDGSDQYGSLALRGRYPFVVFFELKTTKWHKLTFHWRDLAPESQADPIGSFGAVPPSGIIRIRIGTRWTIGHNNAKVPKHSYCIDQIQLEPTVPAPAKPPTPRAFSEVLAKLKRKEPVRIQCMGDSITAGTGLANRDAERYATRTQEILRAWLGYDDITCYSRAVGGAKVNDGRAWIPRDFRDEAPDLVTIWYGYNDKSGAHTADYFKRSLNDYIDRVCHATGGKTAFLLFATGPGCGPRFTMLDDFAQAVREITDERGLGLFDVNRELKTIGRKNMPDYFGDMAHPNKKGHLLIANRLCDFLVASAGIDTPKPKPPKKPVVKPGQANFWDFEEGTEGWIIDTKEISLVENRASSGLKSLKFDMPTATADHRHAYSPHFPVLPGQVYRIEADTFLETALKGGGRYGIYVTAYHQANGEGTNQVLQVRGVGYATKLWEHWRGTIEIPTGMLSARIMIWCHRDATATFYADTIRVTPLKPE
ncbi:MAG: SGNH/GDSL hydrolase family protein [Lentisphaeria bacterium]|nr:SGNH/GDSL hydrolase family protein [Lentisphaeria bacterium]